MIIIEEVKRKTMKSISKFLGESLVNEAKTKFKMSELNQYLMEWFEDKDCVKEARLFIVTVLNDPAKYKHVLGMMNADDSQVRDAQKDAGTALELFQTVDLPQRQVRDWDQMVEDLNYAVQKAGFTHIYYEVDDPADAEAIMKVDL